MWFQCRLTRQVLVGVYIIFSIGCVCSCRESRLACWPAAYSSGLWVESDFREAGKTHTVLAEFSLILPSDFLLQYFPAIIYPHHKSSTDSGNHGYGLLYNCYEWPFSPLFFYLNVNTDLIINVGDPRTVVSAWFTRSFLLSWWESSFAPMNPINPGTLQKMCNINAAISNT